MLSARVAAPRLLLGMTLLVALHGAVASAEPWRAVARVSSEEDRALLERVRGQSSDLPVLLEVDEGPSLDGDAPAPWRAAVQLAERHQARAVLWFLRVGPDLRVHVAEPASRHLFVRSTRVEGRPGSLAWSTGAEVVALGVRSALRAVEAGDPLGEVVEPVPAPVAEVLVPVAVAPPEPPPAKEAGRWLLAVGAHAALDGYGPRGHQGLLLGAGWEGRSLRLRLQVLAGLPSRLRDARTEVSLGQYSAALWADVPLGTTGTVGWATGLGVGVAGFARRTVVLAPDVEPAPPRVLPALVFGPEILALWRLGRGTGLEASLAAEVVVGRPLLGYVIDGNFVPRGDGWVVRPRLGLAMVFFP